VTDFFIVLQIVSISNKHFSIELSIHQRILKNKIVSLKILSSTTVFSIDNNKKCYWAANQQFRM